MKTTLMCLAVLAIACDNRPRFTTDAGTLDGGPRDAAAADGGPFMASCDARATATPICSDYIILDANMRPSWEDACTNGGGTFSAGLCTHTNSLGGCRQAIPGFGTATAWYYQGGTLTAAEVESNCEASGGTYLAP